MLLVGNKADLAREREVEEVTGREIAESRAFYAYVEACSLEGEAHGVPRVQQLLAELTGLDVPVEQLRRTIADPTRSRRLPAAAARLFSRGSSKKTDDKKARSVSPPPRRPYERASSWLFDPTEDMPAAVSGVEDAMPTGDVKLRAISKAIYDIRGAGAEKCKAIAKYKEREVSQWLSRSRYFGPTESSRHKRWQEDQKRKKQQQQQLVMQQQLQQRIRQRVDPIAAAAAALQPPMLERRRSLSHPGKFPPKPNVASSSSCSSCSELSDTNEEATAPMDGEGGTATSAEMERQLQMEVEAQRLRRAAKRAMRKKIRAASADIYERHSSSYLFNTPPPRLEAVAPNLWAAHQRRPAAPVGSELMPPRRSRAGSHSAMRSPSAQASPSARAPVPSFKSPTLSPAPSPSARRSTASRSPPHSKSPPLKPRSARGDKSLAASMRQPGDLSVNNDILDLAAASGPSKSTATTNSVSAMPARSPATVDNQPETPSIVEEKAVLSPELPVAAVPLKVTSEHALPRAGDSTTSEELDCADIDDMLDYFDNVTLSL